MFCFGAMLLFVGFAIVLLSSISILIDAMICELPYKIIDVSVRVAQLGAMVGIVGSIVAIVSLK